MSKRSILAAGLAVAVLASAASAATIVTTKTQATNTAATVDNATVTFIVDAGSTFNNSSFLLTDSTGSLLTFRVGTVAGTSTTTPYPAPAVGDNITISGNYQLFNNLSELTGNATNPFSVTVNSSGNALPAPSTFTVADLQDGSLTAEALESTRGTLTNVHFTSGTGTNFAAGTSYTVANADNTLTATVRTQSATTSSGLALLGTPVPTGNVDIFGFLGQFSTTNANGGYQFAPVSITAAGVPEPTMLSVLGLGGVAALRRRRA